MAKLVRIANRHGEVPRNAVHRAGGAPIGMTKETWPVYEGAPMHHVLTLGREYVASELPSEVAAIAVFINNPMKNEAFTPETKETAVVLLGPDDLARGGTPAEEVFGAPLDGEGIAPGVLIAEFDEYTFDEQAVFEDEDERAPENELDDEAIGWAMGDYLGQQLEREMGSEPVFGLSAAHTMWIQTPELPDGYEVLFQFYDQLVDGLNCGDGHMYVASNGTEAVAWWQC